MLVVRGGMVNADKHKLIFIISCHCFIKVPELLLTQKKKKPEKLVTLIVIFLLFSLRHILFHCGVSFTKIAYDNDHQPQFHSIMIIFGKLVR